MSSTISTDAVNDFNIVEGGFSQSTITKRRKHVSTVWEEFVLVPKEENPDGKLRAKCKYCGMEHPDPQISEMSKEMKIKFDKYWSCYSMVLSFAVICDPRYKLEFVKFCFNKLNPSTAKEKVDEVHAQLVRLFKEYAKKNPPSSFFLTRRGNSNSNSAQEDDFAEFNFFEDNTQESKHTELDLYLKEAKEDRKSHLDVLTWWKLSQNRFPILSLMVRDILSKPITMVASESAFSMGGRVISKWRASLLPETAQVLITTRHWLYGYNVDEDEDQEVFGLDI